MKRKNNHSRRGLSLVETLVIIALGSVLLGGVVAGMTALMRADDRIASADQDRRALLAIASRLRADLHQAQQAEWTQPQRLELTTAEGDIAYWYRGEELHRSAGEKSQPLPSPAGVSLADMPGLDTESNLMHVQLGCDSLAYPLRLTVFVGRDLLEVEAAEDLPEEKRTDAEPSPSDAGPSTQEEQTP